MPKVLNNRGVNTFLSGVLSLSISTVVVKIIGLVYKIPMLSLVGGEGMGYFNSAYEIYALLCIVSITGLPVAMSVIISKNEDKSGADGVLKLSLLLFGIIGIVSMVLMAILSREISLYLKSEKVMYCILAISPSLAFVCMGSAYKGYFQGLSDMKPICISGIIEAASKLVFGLIFAEIALRLGFPNHIVAAFGVFSISLGSLISLLYFVLYKRRLERGVAHKEHIRIPKDTRRAILVDIIRISFPATCSSLLISLTRVIDMIMILRRLQDIGYSSADANMMYGSFTTMAIPIFSLASALVASISVPLIPELARSVALGDIALQGERISCAISLTSYISCPAMIGITLFSREILELIFNGQGEGINITTPLLSCLGLSVMTSVLITLTNAILQAYNKAQIPILSMSLGCVVKIILSFVLIGNEKINILGAPIGTFFCDLIICILNFLFIFKYYKGKISFKKAVSEPAACATLAIVPVFFIMRALEGNFSGRSLTVACIGTSGLLYLILAGRKILKLKNLGG